MLLPDEGYRYQDTVYDDAWLAAGGWSATAEAGSPVEVTDPVAAESGWSRMAWGRKTLAEVSDLAGVR